MSDSKKPGGSRDISDLKARLGLKKGAAAPATGQQPRANGTSGGVVAPPGLNLQPPPGLAPAQPAQPAAPPPPNAHEDPFGAMNHMAAVGQVHRAPEIVIVNDGKPVENVGADSSGASIAKIAIPAALALIVGIVVGKVGAQNGSYNAGLGDIKGVLGAKGTPSTVAELKSQLSAIDTMLDEQKSKNGFKPDKGLDDALEKAAKALDVKKEIIFRAKENSITPEVSGAIISFYAGVTELKSMIDIHMKSAKYDEMAFKKAKDGKDAGELKDTDNAALAGQFRYAVFLQAPTDTDKSADFGAKLVEIGPPYCGDKIASSGKCADGNSPTGWTYRAEPGAPFTQGDIAQPGESIPSKKIVMLLPGGVRDSLVQGADGVASQALYQRRVRAIYERIHGDGRNVRGLLEEGNKLETTLQTEAGRGKKFSFFM
ncbi:MAG TPA: hypothetical protein VGM90_22915 [Kofleriaceae bacterium]